MKSSLNSLILLVYIQRDQMCESCSRVQVNSNQSWTEVSIKKECKRWMVYFCAIMWNIWLE
ncbi:uncharacterized protein DS421_10g302810 [Arachis hypogaea]|nr:uncharacterized protein DS421_10g302810 [Arachis hypogaea]